jgi:Protein of unknown function (DUF2637)
MTGQLPARPAHPAEAPPALRVIGLIAVCAGVAALAGAAFVLSYSGIHALALQAGVKATLARGYPFILDVLLVITLAAVLALRGAGWPSRLLAWSSLVVLLAAAAGADALHASGHQLPSKVAAETAAIVPWALVLIAFALLLAMLRHARLRRLSGAEAAEPAQAEAGADRESEVPSPLSMQPLVPGFPPKLDAPKLAIPHQLTPDLAADNRVELPDLSASDDGEPDNDDPSDVAAELEPADETSPDASTDETDHALPVFHRMWSAPVPPDS